MEDIRRNVRYYLETKPSSIRRNQNLTDLIIDETNVQGFEFGNKVLSRSDIDL